MVPLVILSDVTDIMARVNENTKAQKCVIYCSCVFDKRNYKNRRDLVFVLSCRMLSCRVVCELSFIHKIV